MRKRRGFTLIEVLLAAVITAFVMGSLTVSLAGLSRAKDTSKTRLDAHLRADAALNMMRRDIASVVRHEDVFWTRLLIRSGSGLTPIGELDRDEILVFNTRLRLMQDIDFNGEGMQYETQYRIVEGASDEIAMLWQRRDVVPDQFPLAGGIATPAVEGLIALRIEAYDGYQWFRDWDSDNFGLPLAVRLTLTASGSRNGEDLYTAPRAILRTVIPIDRVIPPADLFRPDPDEEEDLEEVEDVSDPEGEAASRAQPRPGVGTERPGQGGRPGAGRRPQATPAPPSGGDTVHPKLQDPPQQQPQPQQRRPR